LNKDEAIHKALKVLNCLNNDRVYETTWVKGAINACEEALEQPAQEPRHVGWAWIHKDGSIWEFDPLKSGEETLGMDYVKLYIHPTWRDQ